MEQRLLVSASPHLRAPDDIRKIMWSVVAALAPAALVSLYFFGFAALKVYVISIATAEAAELLCLRARGRDLSYAADGSAFLTGMLLAMVLPANVSWYVPAVGSAFAVVIAKHTFGGLGNNVWNPALAGRIFVQFAYAAQVTLSAWPLPHRLWGAAADAVSAASPLAKEGAAAPLSHLDLLFGNGVVGSLGETCKIALLIGGIYLIVRNIIDWRIPVFYIGTVMLLALVLPMKTGVTDANVLSWAHDPLYQALSGGLIIGAFFMATDMVTTPVTATGRAIFAIGCGLMVAVVRRYGGYPEGVAYSIVLMNTFTPLIDRWVRPRVYGSTTPKPAPRQA